MIPLLLLLALADAPAPSDKDALSLQSAQIRVLEAKQALRDILEAPVVISARAAIIAAEAALASEKAKHPGCELVGAEWKCVSQKSDPASK